MFIRPEKNEKFKIDWTVISAPNFHANPKEDGIDNENFSIINFSKKIIIIGGTGYTGEIKKGIFSVLNFTLPVQKNVLPMHCSANSGENGDTSIFFGLSGTGKTTLSTDSSRKLIGDEMAQFMSGECSILTKLKVIFAMPKLPFFKSFILMLVSNARS